MTDTITIERGQHLGLQFKFWQDAAKTNPVDLTNAVLTVREASNSDLSQLSVSVTDPLNGVCTCSIIESVSQDLNEGRVNWLRIEAQFSSENIVSPKLWINVDG